MGIPTPPAWTRLFLIPLVALAAVWTPKSSPLTAATSSDTSRYASLVEKDAPVCWWRMSADGSAVINRSAPDSSDGLSALPIGKVQLDAVGPSGEAFPDFASGNVAVRLPAGRNYLRVADPGENSPLDFDNGDALTIEAWIEPAAHSKTGYSYIVGKGRTLKPGHGSRNQNYSLRLANSSTTARLSFFFVDAETPDKSSSHNADGHRWTSKASVPLDGRWHHVALTYTFGKPESIKGFIDGRPTGGSWELGGPTTKRPIVDDDDLWIGSSMSGRATFVGAIDEVAIYRRALTADDVKRHVRIHRRDEMQALVDAAAESAPSDHVQFDIFEGAAVVNSWDFRPHERQPLYESDVFALTELPRKYDRRGLIVDRPTPILVHGYARLTLPPGQHKLALRSLNAARLYIDGDLVAENPFLKVSGNGHGKVYQLKPQSPDRLSLPAAHSEKIITFESDGLPHVFSVFAATAIAGRPAEMGELVVARQTGDAHYQLLGAFDEASPGAAVAHRKFDDAGWFAFLERDRARRRSWEAEQRQAISRAEDAWWEDRHAAARKLLDESPQVEPPTVEDDAEVNNAVDRFIQRRLEEAGFDPAPLVDDLAFLRRLSLDVVGVIPSPRQVELFLADPPETRRSAAIDRLLADPGWADHWVGYWQHVLAENPGLTKPTLNNSGPFRWFLHESFLDNKPLDRLVAELVQMDAGPSAGGPAGFAQATNNDVPMAHKAHIVGTAFLGVEMKCARCHDAPTHESTQRDLFSLAAMLAGKPLSVPKSSTVPGTPEQLAHMAVTVSLKPGEPVSPEWPFASLMAGEEALDEPLARDVDDLRSRLAYTLVHPSNERFAQVFVNRLWKRYLGRGLVEPVHDWEGMEPSHPQLLAFLADELVRNGYDIKHVARLILNSRAYQRDFASGDSADEAQELFAAATRRRLTAEQLADSIFHAVGKTFDSEELCVNPDGRMSAKSFFNLGTPLRAWEFACPSNERERPSMTLPRAQSVVDLLMAYGWHQNRQEPINEREPEVTPLSPLVLANGEAAARAIDFADHGELVRICLEERPVDELVDELMLRFLSRKPTEAERKRYGALLAVGYQDRRTGQSAQQRKVDRSPLSWANNLDAEANRIGIERLELAGKGDPPTRRLTDAWRERAEDMVWAIVNSPEFVFVP